MRNAEIRDDFDAREKTAALLQQTDPIRRGSLFGSTVFLKLRREQQRSVLLVAAFLDDFRCRSFPRDRKEAKRRNGNSVDWHILSAFHLFFLFPFGT